MNNRITSLFGIRYPLIQGGMIWCSGWRLAAAVSNAGGLGVIGAGSMNPEILQEHIRKCRESASAPFGVNLPLLYSRIGDQIDVIIKEKVPVVITSAGNPAVWTPVLKEAGITVAHVVANVKSALKCAQSGVDAVVAEGFEAGGHNGKEETTTLVLIPLIRQAVTLPLIAAGGIASGRAMAAAMILGADGVQVGSRFAASAESSAHPAFKQAVLEAGDGSTHLILKKLVPVRLLKNKFFHQIHEMETGCASKEELTEFLGNGRARTGMFEGDTEEGELEIGQAAALIREMKPAAGIVAELVSEWQDCFPLFRKDFG